MTPDQAARAAVRVGVVTSAIGAVLTAAPKRAGPLVGLADPLAARLVGLADLAFGTWLWVAETERSPSADC